jgi:FdhD protein
MSAASTGAQRLIWRPAGISAGPRALPREMPIALTYNRNTYAVMMAAPADLEDFAYGFSLTERIVTGIAEIEALEVVHLPDGIELRMELDPARMEAVEQRMRRLRGPTGCGLCGIDSLAEAARPAAPVVASARFAAAALHQAMGLLAAHQPLGEITRAVHAAGFWHPARGIVAVREDVGRHNALDKLAGALARLGVGASAGVVLLTSRVSVEMIQKAAAIGAGVVAAVSVPTALALRDAEQAGMTLVAVARHDGFEIFCHPERIETELAHVE